MSKRAEERALEIFPVKKVPYYGLACNAYSERDANLDNRTLFCMGYEQAEKDLALAWEDMVLLRTLFDATDANQAMGALTVQPMTREYYEYLLRSFNEQRQK